MEKLDIIILSIEFIGLVIAIIGFKPPSSILYVYRHHELNNLKKKDAIKKRLQIIGFSLMGLGIILKFIFIITNNA